MENKLTPTLNLEQLKQNIDALKSKGFSDLKVQEYVNNYKQDQSGSYVLKNTPAPQTQITPTESNVSTADKGASTGLMTGHASLLAVLPQLAAKTYITTATKQSQEATQGNIKVLTEIAQRSIELANKEVDPVKKQKLFEVAIKASKDAGMSAKVLESELKDIKDAQKIDTPIGDIPALSDNPLEAARQVAGRGIQTVGLATTGLGATGSGAALGFGKSIEEGAGLKDAVLQTGAYALGGKILGGVFNKLGGTTLGQKVLGSKVAQGIGKVLSVGMTKDATSAAGMAVDLAAKKFGETAEQMLSPTAWLQGLHIPLKTPTDKLLAAEKKLGSAYRDALNLSQKQTQMELKTGKQIDEILVREEVPLQSYKEAGKLKLDTSQGQEMLKMKSDIDNAAFDAVLKTSDERVNMVEFAKSTDNLIRQKFQGAEQQKALNQFSEELSAWAKQFKSSGLINENGEVPVYAFNQFKKYFWGKVRGFNSPEAILSGDVDFVVGDSAKEALQSAVKDADIQSMNSYLGDLAYAMKILEKKMGSVLPSGGLTSKYFSRAIGALAGSSMGPAGTISGVITAEKVAELMIQRKATASGTYNLVQNLRKKLGKEADTLIKEAMRIIEQRAAQKALQLRLEAPATMGSPKNPFITPQPKTPTTFEEQAPLINYAQRAPETIKPHKEITPLKPYKVIEASKKAEGEILKTTQPINKVASPDVVVAPKSLPAKTKVVPLPKDYKSIGAHSAKFKTFKEWLNNLKSATVLPMDETVRITQLENLNRQGLDESDLERIFRQQKGLPIEVADKKSAIANLKAKAVEMGKKKITDPVSDLLSEAKKYKTAEEFVSGYKKLYRGSKEDFIPEKININERDPGTSFSTSDSTAKFFAGKHGMVREYYIPKDANVIDIIDVPKKNGGLGGNKDLAELTPSQLREYPEASANIEAAARWARENGYDGMFSKLSGENELRIFKDGLIKTKSQLTDIWNQANKK